MANASRVASNLATNQLTWEIMETCPALTDFAREYGEAHARGLEEVALGMACETAHASEGNRYIEGLRSLLATKRALLMPRHLEIPEEAKAKYLGWYDEHGAYLVPDIAYAEVAVLLRDSGGLNGVTKNAIHKQLAGMNVLETTGKDGPVCVKWCGNRSVRVLHLKPEVLLEQPDGEEEGGDLPG